MLRRIFGWVQVPTSAIIVVNTPNPLLVTNEGKSDGSRHFVEVDAQELIDWSLHIGTAAGDRAFGLHRHACKATCSSQGGQKLIDEPLHIHRLCSAS